MGNLKEYRDSKNVAELLSEEKLKEIGSKIISDYEIDLDSRREWEEVMHKALKLVKQIPEAKSQANLAKSANIKYPLITKAAIDFAARVYPEIVQGSRVVGAKVVGNDPDLMKSDRATRVSKHMSYQLLDKNSEWEDNQDRLLHMLPVFGTVFKKIYYDPIKKRNVDFVVPPSDIVVNQNVPNLIDARRVTHKLNMYNNDIVERVRAGLYRDIGEIQPTSEAHSPLEVDISLREDDVRDEDAPILLLEQHCYLDLDEDGYSEPYVVVVHSDTGEVLRIVQRFKEVIERGGIVQRIVPEQFFVDYHFIKNPDGGFYSLGFGSLLTPINESINTILNQLIDAGTLSNLQSGFIGKGLRMSGGTIPMPQGDWKVLDVASGGDLKSNIVPIPAPGPSPVLFSLLGLLIEAGNDIASINDILDGKQPAQNVPATTVLTLVEQGLKVFNTIVKRLYRAMRKEFTMLFELNSKHVSDIEYQRVLDDVLASVKVDYNSKDLDVSPVADPSMSSDAQRLARARAILEVPTIDPRVASQFYLKSLGIEDEQIAKFLPEPDPNAPPPPEVQKVMAEVEKLKAEAQALMVEQQALIEKLRISQQDSDTRTAEAQGRIGKMNIDSQVNVKKMQVVADKSAVETELKSRDQINRELKGEKELSQKDIQLMLEAITIKNNANTKDSDD